VNITISTSCQSYKLYSPCRVSVPVVMTDEGCEAVQEAVQTKWDVSEAAKSFPDDRFSTLATSTERVESLPECIGPIACTALNKTKRADAKPMTRPYSDCDSGRVAILHIHRQGHHTSGKETGNQTTVTPSLPKAELEGTVPHDLGVLRSPPRDREDLRASISLGHMY
jgi:hypothetical protein